MSFVGRWGLYEPIYRAQYDLETPALRFTQCLTPTGSCLLWSLILSVALSLDSYAMSLFPDPRSPYSIFRPTIRSALLASRTACTPGPTSQLVSCADLQSLHFIPVLLGHHGHLENGPGRLISRFTPWLQPSHIGAVAL